MTKAEMAAQHAREWATRAKLYQHARSTELVGAVPVPVKYLPILTLAMADWRGDYEYGTDASTDRRDVAKWLREQLCPEALDPVVTLIEGREDYLDAFSKADE